MSDWIYTDAGRTAILDGSFLTKIAGGALAVQTSAPADLYVATLASPAGTVSAGVLTLTTVPYSGASAGTAAKCQLRQVTTGTVLANGTCTVNGGGGSITRAAGQTTTVASGEAGMIGGTITQPTGA